MTVAAALLLAVSTSAFCPGGIGALSSSLRVCTVRLQERDAAARAAARAAKAAGQTGSTFHKGKLVKHDEFATRDPEPTVAKPTAQRRPPARSPVPSPSSSPAGDLDGDSITLALEEFVQSDWARQACNYCNVGPTDHGKLWGMFETVRVQDTTLVVKLKRAFEQRSNQLLDRLTKHLRARLPQVKRLQYEQGTTTRTIVLRN